METNDVSSGALYREPDEPRDALTRAHYDLSSVYVQVRKQFDHCKAQNDHFSLRYQ